MPIASAFDQADVIPAVLNAEETGQADVLLPGDTNQAVIFADDNTQQEGNRDEGKGKE